MGVTCLGRFAVTFFFASSSTKGRRMPPMLTEITYEDHGMTAPIIPDVRSIENIRASHIAGTVPTGWSFRHDVEPAVTPRRFVKVTVSRAGIG